MKSTSATLVLFIELMVCLALLSGCATEVAPGGGPRDTTPPSITSMNPKYASTNFNAKKIEIEFDEFIQLKNYKQQLVISPPFKNDPEIFIRGKKLIIKILNDLQPDNTYRLFFGDAIVDYNEGNALHNLQYVFSTGQHIDSSTVNGMLLDAYTKKPVKNTLVTLYDDKSDSAFVKTLPRYVTKTDANGLFTFEYLADTTYRIYAVDDKDNSYNYSLNNENIAFADADITPNDSTVITLYMFDYQVNTDTINSGKLEILARQKGKIHYTDTLQLHFNHAIKSVINDSVLVVQSRDTVTDTLYTTIHCTDTAEHCAYVDMAFVDGWSYTFTIKDSSFVDIFGNYNAGYTHNVVAADTNAFGKIVVRVKSVNDTITDSENVAKSSDLQYIVGLFDKGDIMVGRYLIVPPNADFVVFDNVLPATGYFVRVIRDDDKNVRYTSGDYYRKRQPEVVEVGKNIDVKANFTVEETILIDFQ